MKQFSVEVISSSSVEGMNQRLPSRSQTAEERLPEHDQKPKNQGVGCRGDLTTSGKANKGCQIWLN